jgi:adenylate cyclase
MDDGSGDVAHSFALRTALSYLATKGIQATPDPERPEWLRLAGRTLRPFGAADGGYSGADDAGYQILLDCRSEGFETVSMGSLLRGEIAQEDIRDRIVLVGQSSESVRDFAAVPCGASFGSGSLLPGVEIHAHLVDQLVRTAMGASTPLHVLPDWQEIILVAGLVAFGVLIPIAVRPSLLFVPGVLLGWCAFGLVGFGLFRAGIWIPMAAPALGWTAALGASLASRANRERAERSQLMQLFSSHVAPEVAEMIWSRRADFLEGGRLRAQRLVATVLFVDMKGYTAQAEKLEPEQLLDWVNGFMEPMARKVAERGGVVDDYFGDGFKANFGAPFARHRPEEIRSDAQDAVRCALAMRQILAELNSRHRPRGLPSIAMRVGVHTGPVVAGIVGGASKLKYTTVGDTVVIAQRLESLDQHEHDFAAQPVRILISRATLDQLGDGFATHLLGSFALRGKEISTEVHELLGEES